MNLKKSIINIIFIALIGSVVLSANSSSPVISDPYTGLYFVHGSKIVTYYRCPFIDACGPDSGPFYDTTRIASVVVVKFLQEKTDTLHFFGLPGADEGEIKLYHGRTQIGDYVGSMLQYDGLTGFRVYGLHSNDTFEIDHNNAGNRYKGIGTISNNKIEITGQKTYRTITVEYDMQGEKIDNYQKGKGQ